MTTGQGVTPWAPEKAGQYQGNEVGSRPDDIWLHGGLNAGAFSGRQIRDTATYLPDRLVPFRFAVKGSGVPVAAIAFFVRSTLNQAVTLTYGGARQNTPGAFYPCLASSVTQFVIPIGSTTPQVVMIPANLWVPFAGLQAVCSVGPSSGDLVVIAALA